MGLIVLLEHALHRHVSNASGEAWNLGHMDFTGKHMNKQVLMCGKWLPALLLDFISQPSL